MILLLFKPCSSAVSSHVLTTCARMQICNPLVISGFDHAGHRTTNISDLFRTTLQRDEFLGVHNRHVVGYLTMFNFGKLLLKIGGVEKSATIPPV